jgi:hypothetical protein
MSNKTTRFWFILAVVDSVVIAALSSAIVTRATAQQAAQQQQPESVNEAFARHLKANAGDCAVSLAQWQGNADFLNSQLTALYAQKSDGDKALTAANKQVEDLKKQVEDLKKAAAPSPEGEPSK